MTAPQPISMERALQLRKAGAPVARLARLTQLPLDEFQGELAMLLFDKHPEVDPETALALEQCDALTSALWPAVVNGDAAAVSQVISVAARRDQLLSRSKTMPPARRLDNAMADLLARTRSRHGDGVPADDQEIE